MASVPEPVRPVNPTHALLARIPMEMLEANRKLVRWKRSDYDAWMETVGLA